MILPTTFFDFTQEANDFYFPPLVGTYLRVLRVTVFLISLLITPAWYLMVSSPGRLPSWLDFLSSRSRRRCLCCPSCWWWNS